MQDLSEFCSDKFKFGVKYGLLDFLVILLEMGEVIDGMMDIKMVYFFIYYVDKIEFVYFLDQFFGLKIM